MFWDSAFGKRVAAETEARQAKLAAENRQIEAELAEEEEALTEQRATLEPAAFRALADAFDTKVQDTRAAQDTKLRAINEEVETAREAFLASAGPVLEQLMREAGAAVIIERRFVFVSVSAVEITEEAILRINDSLGDGEEGQ